MIPGEWFPRKLGDVTTWRSGGTPPMSNKSFWNGDIPWISASTMYSNAFDTSTKFISAEGLKTGSKLASPNDLLLLVRGSMLWNRIPIGIAKTDLAFNQDVKSITVDSSLRPNFLLFWFLANENKLLHMVTGTGIGAGKLDTKELQAIRIEVPPLPEQKKIAQILSTWDKGIETVEKLIENSQQKKKALMQQLLTGKKRFPEFDGEWKEVRLGDVVKITTGASKTKYIDENGERFILDMGSVSRDGKLIPSKRTSYADNHLFKGQLVMPKDDIGGGNIIGRVGYVDQDDKYILGDHVYALSVNTVDPLFLSYLINGFTVNKSLRRKANGTAQLGLGRKDVEKQVIVIPPSVKEQQQITSALSSADQEIKTWQQELAHLKQEKKALMQQLLTGKRRVKLSKQENHHANLL